jgi:LPXTG-site transpeptidase (sortase) family protein
VRLRARAVLASLGLIGILVLVGAAISVGLGGFPLNSDNGVAPSPSPTADGAAAGPSVAAPSVATPVQPGDRIVIDRLGIDLPITEGDGLDAPLDSAAHYPGTGWPGDGTNIYLYAHARPGLFQRLPEAKVGDRVVLRMADGSSHLYAVGKIIPTAPWDAMTYVDHTDSEQLTLQTSTSETATDPRFIVIAYPAK